MPNIELHNGDCLEVMKSFNDEIIGLTFTSPPYYNAKEYSTYDNYEAYLSFLKDVFVEVHRVTMEGRFVVVNTSPVIVARKSRQTQSTRLPIPFDLNGIMTKIGFDFIDDIIWVKPNASVPNRNSTFRQTKKPLTYKPNCITEYIMVYRKKTNKLIDWNLKRCEKEIMENSIVKGDYDITNVWNISPVHTKSHPAVFPKGLSDKIIKYYSFVNDNVLDPFMGIGTTGISCMNLNRNFIGIELEKNYFDIAKRRIEEANNKLF